MGEIKQRQGQRRLSVHWLVVLPLLAAAAGAGSILWAMPSGATPDAVIAIGSASAAPSQQVNVSLEAQAVPSPGVGAFVVDVGYDPAVVEAAGCQAAPGFVCNVAYTAASVRCGGFDPFGRTDSVSLCTIAFRALGQLGRCGALTVAVAELVDVNGALLGHTTSDGAFCMDVDGDGVTDVADNCPSAANADQTDGDRDGQGDACDPDDDNDSLGQTRAQAAGGCPTDGPPLPTFRDCIELFVGTDPLDACADTTTARDEAVDKMPADLNDDRKVNSTDVSMMKQAIKANSQGNYDKRFDLDASGRVDSTDLSILNGYANLTRGKACSVTP